MLFIKRDTTDEKQQTIRGEYLQMAYIKERALNERLREEVRSASKEIKQKHVAVKWIIGKDGQSEGMPFWCERPATKASWVMKPRVARIVR